MNQLKNYLSGKIEVKTTVSPGGEPVKHKGNFIPHAEWDGENFSFSKAPKRKTHTTDNNSNKHENDKDSIREKTESNGWKIFQIVPLSALWRPSKSAG